MKPEEVKKIPLGLFPTPLQRMSNLERELGCGPLYIKRDDLSDLGLGGNKIRKLEYLVADAIQQGCNTLLTYGGPQTNHGRLTVAAAVRNGMKSILILHGAKPDYLSGNLVLDKMMGADLYFTEGDGEEQKALAQKVMAEYGARGDKVYEIPVGGSNVLGALGYLMMIPELMKQLDEMGASAKYLVTGSGSLGTFCGLWAGAKYFRAGFEVGRLYPPDQRCLFAGHHLRPRGTQAAVWPRRCELCRRSLQCARRPDPGGHAPAGPHGGHFCGPLLYRQILPRFCRSGPERLPQRQWRHLPAHRWDPGHLDKRTFGCSPARFGCLLILVPA